MNCYLSDSHLKNPYRGKRNANLNFEYLKFVFYFCNKKSTPIGVPSKENKERRKSILF